jgi:hypothetical protein
MTAMEVCVVLACLIAAFLWCVVMAGARQDPAPPRLPLRVLDERPWLSYPEPGVVMLQEDGAPLMRLGTEDPADVNQRGYDALWVILTQPADPWDADGWWDEHAGDVRAAVCRVGVDLRRGRYRR